MIADNQKISWPGWETVKFIGKGSFGAVYEIQRDVLGDIEKSALKVISIPQNDSDIEELYAYGYNEESVTSTFRNHLKSIISEYALMRKLSDCANIVNCDDVRYVQHDDGIGWDIFIKMELLTPLFHTLPAVIPEEMVINIGKDLCTALVLCKKHDIVHRDIKPQNIFVSPNGVYKLGDFGVAKIVEKTTGGTKIGTYKYMAPEVYHNQPYGTAADIYSLGLVLYWLLNERRMPFMPLPPQTLSVATDEESRRRRLSGEPIPAPVHGSDALKAIVLKACAFDPKDRYQTAAEMLQDLTSLDHVVTIGSQVTSFDTAVIASPEDATCGAWGSAAGNKHTQTRVTDADATVGMFVRNPGADAVQTHHTGTMANAVQILEETNSAAFRANNQAADDAATVGMFAHIAGAQHTEPKPVSTDSTIGNFTNAQSTAFPPADEDATVGVFIDPVYTGNAQPTAAEIPEKENYFSDAGTSVPFSSASSTTNKVGVQNIPGKKSKKAKKKSILPILIVGLLAIAIIVFLLLRSCDGSVSSPVAGSTGNQADVEINTQPGAPNSDEWSLWTDHLPADITAASYEIEQQTLYRSRTKETTSSTTGSSMPGWELYDTVKANGEFGPWSDWSATKVDSSTTREVETQTRYRYRDKETSTSTASSKDGWTKYDTTYSWGDYGAWSSWSTSAVSNSDSRKVETKKQYRYRDITYTTEYTDWSAWSKWQTSAVTETSLRKVETRKVYRYYCFYCKNCGAAMPYQGHYSYSQCYTKLGGCGRSGSNYNVSGSAELYLTNTPKSGKYWAYDKYYVTANGQKWYISQTTSATTQYRYATRSTKQVANYGSWSSWGDTAYSSSSTREVETRTVYRYCDRSKVATYHFYRWGDWSNWSATKVSESNDRQVETATYYRYREQPTTTTYYFSRWSDWSDYSSMKIDPSDDTEVETKTQYRYRSKK